MSTRFAAGLLVLAPQTPHVSDLMSLKLVIFLGIEAVVVPDLVVAEAAGVKFSLAYGVWALQLALAQVVLAAVVLFVVGVAVDHVFDLLLLTLPALAAVLVPRGPDHFWLLLYFILEGRGLRLGADLHFTFLLIAGLGLFLEVSVASRLHWQYY